MPVPCAKPRRRGTVLCLCEGVAVTAIECYVLRPGVGFLFMLGATAKNVNTRLKCRLFRA